MSALRCRSRVFGEGQPRLGARLQLLGARNTRTSFAANSEPGRWRPTGRSLLPLRHGDQAFALGKFPGGLARAPDRFSLFAGLAHRWFFIRPAPLHLAKNALALQLLFENPKSLIDIVVANKYLQNFSNLLSALNARQAIDGVVAASAF
jgi:hypothetical protein